VVNMPWTIEKREDEWCVFRQGADGDAAGESLGCHATQQEAQQQLAALNAQESKMAVKFLDNSETEIEGLLAPYGGPFNGRDLMGEFFSAKTDFALDWFTERPLLYQHGLDDGTGITVVGRIKAISPTDLGQWMKAQLDAANEYYEAIKELIKQGKLGLSSGSMRHLVQANTKTGEILRWPIVEGSLTPTPANPLADVAFAEVKGHYKAIGVELPETEEALGAVLGVDITEEESVTKAAHSPTSWEDVRSQIQALCHTHMAWASPFEPQGYCYVEATFSDHAIVALEHQGAERHFSVPFTLDEDNNVTSIGDPVEVEAVFVPTPAAMSMGMMIDTTKTYIAELVERTQDLHERRAKEGRVISDDNRHALQEYLGDMANATETIKGLLRDSDPAKAEMALRRVQVLKLKLAAIQYLS